MRCFVAAWPDAVARAGCDALIEALRPHAAHGRVMRSENLHLTLAFIGDLADERGAQVAAACLHMKVAPYAWQLDAIGHFARPRVLWAGGPLTPELEAVAAQARALLDRLHIGYDRKPFVPHVTLLRDVRRYSGPRVIAPPVPWTLGEVALYRSGRDADGARYVRVAPG